MTFFLSNCCYKTAFFFVVDAFFENQNRFVSRKPHFSTLNSNTPTPTHTHKHLHFPSQFTQFKSSVEGFPFGWWWEEKTFFLSSLCFLLNRHVSSVQFSTSWARLQPKWELLEDVSVLAWPSSSSGMTTSISKTSGTNRMSVVFSIYIFACYTHFSPQPSSSISWRFLAFICYTFLSLTLGMDGGRNGGTLMGMRVKGHA